MARKYQTTFELNPDQIRGLFNLLSETSKDPPVLPATYVNIGTLTSEAKTYGTDADYCDIPTTLPSTCRIKLETQTDGQIGNKTHDETWEYYLPTNYTHKVENAKAIVNNYVYKIGTNAGRHLKARIAVLHEIILPSVIEAAFHPGDDATMVYYVADENGDFRPVRHLRGVHGPINNSPGWTFTNLFQDYDPSAYLLREKRNNYRDLPVTLRDFVSTGKKQIMEKHIGERGVRLRLILEPGGQADVASQDALEGAAGASQKDWRQTVEEENEDAECNNCCSLV